MNERLLSITEFLTDGSLARLCDSLSALVGVQVTLRDKEGRLVLPAESDPPWIISEPDQLSPGLARAFEAHVPGTPILPFDGRLLIPLEISGHSIGALVVDGTLESLDPEAGAAFLRTVQLVAQTIDEICDQDILLRYRHEELGLLFRLSSLLAASRDVEAMLGVALDSAHDIFGVHAGTVHLLQDDRRTLELASHFGLSPTFIERFSKLPADRVLDQDSLKGRIITVENLIEDGQALMLDTISAEGLTGMASAGLIFRQRPFGIMRLYTRGPLLLEDEEQDLLKTIAELVASAVASARLLEAERAHRATQRQVKLAADVQRRMLPARLPSIASIDLAARYDSCFELGGDFYDVIDLNGNFGLVVGDVVGKGVPAALLMAAVRASLRAHAEDVYHIHEVIQRVNRTLTENTLDNEFITIFFGVLEPRSLKLTYCNAGHEPPLILRAGADGRARIDRLTAGGMAVAIDASQRYESATVQLAPGDALVLYTDGVMDALNFAGEKFGRNRFEQAARHILELDAAATARQMVDHILWEMRRFVGLNEPTDDVTLLAVRAARG